MSRVYSAQLISTHVNAGVIGIYYTVPVGFTTVVRNASIVVDGSANNWTFSAVADVPSLNSFIFKFDGPQGPGSRYWEGNQVLNAGDSIQLAATGQGVFLLLSGYELQN